MSSLKTSRGRVRLIWLIWLITGLIGVAVVGIGIIRSNDVHATNVRGSKIDENYVVECDIVNPTGASVTVVITSTIFAPSTNRKYGDRPVSSDAAGDRIESQ